MESSSRSEIDELCVTAVQVKDDVLVLDVSMHNASVTHLAQRVDDLPEQTARLGVVERSSLGDVVEQVDALRRPFQHEHMAVRAPEVVEQMEDPGDVVDATQKIHFLGNVLPVVLQQFVT